MIIAVGFKVNNERAVQFRKWANNIVKDYTIKGWVKDEKSMMLAQAETYLDVRVAAVTDEQYGEGFSNFLNRAIIACYER